jgi:hypothetical protein
MRLLAGVELGRIVFTHHALPAVRPVNHLVHNDEIIIRTHLGAAIASVIDGPGTVVAYEADDIDAREHLGWSVIVTGRAHLIRDHEQITRFLGLLRPWVTGEMDQVIRLRPELINGFELTEDRYA